MRRNQVIKITLCLTAIFALFGATINTAYADDENVGGYLSVGPAYFKPDNFGILQPGEIYSRSISVSNTGTEASSFTVSVEPLSVNPADYSAIWGAAPSQYNKIVDWIEFTNVPDEGYTVAPGKSTNVDFTIHVPEDAAGGAQAAMILIDIGKSADTGTWNVLTSLGVQVYANVDGDIRVGAEVSNQYIANFSFTSVISSGFAVANSGNIEVDAVSRLEVNNYFTGANIYTDTQSKLVHPETARAVQHDWKNAPSIGIFKVTQTVTLLETEYPLTRTVIIFPVWLLIVAILFFVLLIVTLILAVKKRGKIRRH
jgi:hypothetical protein